MKNLVIAPHVDDEVLGCGGILNKDFHVVFCGMQEYHILPAVERYEELKSVADYLGFTWRMLTIDKVNYYRKQNYIDLLQDIINEGRPDKIFIPYPSYNQDHQAIYKACMIALRPHDKNHFVKKVLMCESTDCNWGCAPYEINHLVKIDINRKLKAYYLYGSQVRRHRSPDYIEAIAVTRGQMMGESYAEGYIIKRWIE